MKRIIAIGILLFLILPRIIEADKKYNDYYLLLDMANDIEAKVEEGEILFNGIIKDEFIEEGDMRKIGEEIKDDLNIIGEEIDPLIAYDKKPEEFYTKEVIFDEGFSQITYMGHDISNNYISIILSSYLGLNGEKGETYLYINIAKTDDFLEINDIIDKIDHIFEISKKPVEITSHVIGTIPGKVNEKDMRNKVESALVGIKGEIVEEHGDEFYSSYTVYSPLIKDYLTISNNKINLNLAIRYNKDEDKTSIIIGTPVITNWY